MQWNILYHIYHIYRNRSLLFEWSLLWLVIYFFHFDANALDYNIIVSFVWTKNFFNKSIVKNITTKLAKLTIHFLKFSYILTKYCKFFAKNAYIDKYFSEPMSWWANIPVGKNPSGQKSEWAKIPVGKCPSGQKS